MRFIVIVTLLFATQALANEALESCAAIENDLDRLACYDKVSGRTPEVSETPASDQVAWKTKIEKSNITDDTTVILNTTSAQALSCNWNYGGYAQLFVRCLKNRTSIFLNTGCYMIDHKTYGEVTYRIDDREAIVRRMKESTGNQALGFWKSRQAIALIKSWFGAKRALFRFTPFNENPILTEFDITGLEEAIKPLRKACGW